MLSMLESFCKKRIVLLAVCCCVFIAGCFLEQPEVFDQSKANTLTKEQKSQMDVDFFNVFLVRSFGRGVSASKLGSPRGDIVHGLAEQGFELAWLAEKLYDFHHLYRDRGVEHGDLILGANKRVGR